MLRLGRAALLLLAVLAMVSVRAQEARAETISPMIFPVGGPARYSNDYGAPRSGGRTHGGNDIFGSKLTHLVAAEDGYVNWWIKDSGLSGNMLELVGNSGYRYWYIHINNDNPGTDDGAGGDRWAWAPGIEPGAPVRAGQFIAYLGDSGNAESTSPHLHFETHYPDGSKFNPFDSLNAAARWEEPDPTQGFAFHEYLTIQNPADQTTTVSPKYLTNATTVDGAQVVLPPKSRRTVRVNNELPQSEVSAELFANSGVVAERPMYFMYGPGLWTGGHDALGLTAPRTDTFFAEGYTGAGFEEYITLTNPNTDTAGVDIAFLVAGGGNVDHHVDIAPRRRTTVNVRGVVGDNKEVSAAVHSNRPILAERPMYFAYGSEGWTGGHVTSGVGQLATTAYFAEGYTGTGFDEWLTIANPNAQAAQVTIDFLLQSGSPVQHSISVGAETRATVNVRGVIGSGKETSVRINSDIPIATERPMYFRSTAWNGLGPVSGGHAATGVTQPQTEWLFAEGYTGSGFQEYLTIQNPTGSSANVTVEYQGQGGGIGTHNLVVPANRRSTVNVNGDVGAGREVSMRVTSSQPIVAERPMYFRYLGIWTGGHVSPGAVSPSSQWFFSEGYTG